MRRKKNIVLAASALVLTTVLSVGSAHAYFTTYSTASGSVELQMGFTQTVLHEDVDKDGKHITIENVGDYDCFVRVKAFAPVELSYPKPHDGWSEGADGFWYYEEILPAGGTTTELLVSYQLPTPPAGDSAQSDTNLPKEIDVVVIQECTPVVYDEDGENPAADWNYVITADGTE